MNGKVDLMIGPAEGDFPNLQSGVALRLPPHSKKDAS
jgi:hypothetical protein